MDVEVYLFERPFFNKPYIFVTMVIDTKTPSNEYTYIRPHGAYYDELVKRNKTIKSNATTAYPKTFLKDNGNQTEGKVGSFFSYKTLENDGRLFELF